MKNKKHYIFSGFALSLIIAAYFSLGLISNNVQHKTIISEAKQSSEPKKISEVISEVKEPTLEKLPESPEPTIYKAEFQPIYKESIPELLHEVFFRNEVYHYEGASYFEADFSSFLTSKIGDIVSIELNGQPYTGEITKIRDSYTSDYMAEEYIPTDGSKLLSFFIKPVGQKEGIKFTLNYQPNEQIQLEVQSGEIGEQRFRVFNGYGVYLSSSQYWKNWNELDIGSIH